MSWVAGVDGCPLGWVRLVRREGELRLDVHATAAELFAARPRPTVLGIDVPIGLTEAGPRTCDRAARKLLGRPRASSVFPAPIRPALRAATRAEASLVTRRVDGRGVGAQAFGIYSRVAEVDRELARAGSFRRRVREVHPEVSFHEWNGGRSLLHGKKTAAGARARRRLVERTFGRGTVRRLFTRARDELGLTRSELADDDVLDACACLWTAGRIASGAARTLPESPPRDRLGLAMEIVR